MKWMFFLALVLSGCASVAANKLTLISVGMGKADVIESMGKPESLRVKGNIEYLIYNFRERRGIEAFPDKVPYFVRLVDGKVESYGRVGDFDSTKDPAFTIKMDSK